MSGLVEGLSVRSTARLANVSLNTVLRNLLWIGEACLAFHDGRAREMKCARLELDEMWAFIAMKEANVPEELIGSMEAGDVWTWIGMDPDSNFIVSWRIGKREYTDALAFVQDVAARVLGRVQITTDQLTHYRTAIEEAFGARADYATLQKVMDESRKSTDGRYIQPSLKGNRIASVMGNPDPTLITTSSIERNNLTVRMSMKRYERATNAFSRSIRHMRAALALHFTYFNFCRISGPIRVTPAMEAGLSDHVWLVEELISLVPPRPDRWASARAKSLGQQLNVGAADDLPNAPQS